MATEVTVVMYVNTGDKVPTQDDIEQTFDVTVTEYDAEEDV